MSEEFSRTESRILSALSQLDEFLLSPLIQGDSGSAPETHRNAHGANQGTSEDGFPGDHRPEASVSQCQTTRNCGPDDSYDMVTGAHKDITYCSPGTSSGNQKNICSASHPRFSREITSATIEANQFLLALQQLENNSNSANFNSIHPISKLPKSLTTTMPTLDGKSEKFELFENVFQTSLKFHNQLTEDDRINYFHSLMTGDAVQTFKNINSPTR